MRRFFGIGIASLAVVGLAVLTFYKVPVVRATLAQESNALQQVVTAVVNDVVPPPPTPTPAVGVGPAPAPLPPITVPTVVPSPTAEPFPVNPPQLAPPTAGAQPTPIPQPQTMVTISVTPCTGANFNVDSGGCKGTAPFTVTYTANWQCFNSPACSNPTFTWSDGQIGQVVQVTYSQQGNYTISVTVTSSYNGVTYQAGSANSVPISVS